MYLPPRTGRFLHEGSFNTNTAWLCVMCAPFHTGVDTFIPCPAQSLAAYLTRWHCSWLFVHISTRVWCFYVICYSCICIFYVYWRLPYWFMYVYLWVLWKLLSGSTSWYLFPFVKNILVVCYLEPSSFALLRLIFFAFKAIRSYIFHDDANLRCSQYYIARRCLSLISFLVAFPDNAKQQARYHLINQNII